MAKEYNIAVMPGDFIGKEVTTEALRILNSTGEKYGFRLNKTNYPHGGEHYIKTGELLTEDTIKELRDHDAIFLGAVGHPDLKKGEVEGGILLKMRFDLDQYVNFRPSKLYEGVEAPIRKLHPDLPNGSELIVVREGTAGLYKGNGGIERDGKGNVKKAWEVMEYKDFEVDRICRYAFNLAQEKGLPITLGYKSNVLKNVSAELWQPIFEKMGKEEFPNVPRDYQHIDALNGPKLISNSPKDLGIIVTGNMFGDIITDLTASLYGGMGVGSSACINPEGTSMFEPLHGSSHKDYGKGVVSPVAAILSGALMLNHLGEREAARGIESAVEGILAKRKIPNMTIHSGVPTTKQTDYILEELLK